MTNRFGLVLVATLAATSFVHAQQATLVSKSITYAQTSGSTPDLSSTNSPYLFSLQSPTAATVAPPGAASFALPANAGNGDYELDVAFTSQAAMDSAYPDGTYVLTPSGGSALNFTLTPDSYPALPMVTGGGGTWQNGVVVVDPLAATPLLFSAFSTYGQGAGSHQLFSLTSLNGDNVNIKQEIVNFVSDTILDSNSAFTKYTFNPGTLKPGFLYQAILKYDALTFLNTAGGLKAAIFSTTTNFYVVGKTGATIAQPVIASQAANVTAVSGGSANFSVGVTFGGVTQAPTNTIYVWYFNGQALNINGTKYVANGGTLTVNTITAADAGSYTLEVVNAGGLADSQAATLTLSQAATAPAITRQPVSQNLPSGATVAFNVAATGIPAPTYQWYFNVGSNTPAAIGGATSSTYVLSNLTSANAGNYSCRASNPNGTATSSQTALTVATAPANPGHLINLSILSNVSGSLSMGFVLGGTGTSGSINVLIRGVGPAIGPGTVFNVGGIMVDPTLSVVQQSDHTKSFANAGWGSNQAAVTTADNATGAFALSDPTSADSALVASLSGVSGGYSATVAGKTGDSGNALTEVYDASGGFSPTNPRLINLSCLTNISAGSTLDVGFVISGVTAKTVLIRASGPAVGPGTIFNVGGVMADPQIVVSTSAAANLAIASNAGWGGDAVLTTVGNSLGAFAYTDGTSKDSAAIVTLEPGIPYAVQVNSVSGGGGNVLVEIYDVNP